jgi:hypothetical protein
LEKRLTFPAFRRKAAAAPAAEKLRESIPSAFKPN